MTTLRNTILESWHRASNDLERAEVLRSFGAALHEIMIERIPHETALRNSIGDIVGRCCSAVMGAIQPSIDHPWQRIHGSAPMAALGGAVDVELARMGERRAMGYAELLGTHAERWQAVTAKRGGEAKPMDGFSGYVYPPEVLNVRCAVCRAEAGEACRGLEKRT